MRPALLLALVLSSAACESAAPGSRVAPAPAAHASRPEGRAATRPPSASSPEVPAGERRFGAPPALEGEPVDVAQVLAAPQRYLNRTIKCAGTVARVCQAAGCWLELRASAQDAPGLRVPMAGHSFFVPRDVAGRPAVVEGVLSARELNDTELAHLKGEGLAATGPLSLAATSVIVR